METFDLQHFDSWRDALVASFQHTFNQIVVLLPKTIGMVVVLVVGYLVARLLDKFVVALAQSMGLERAADRSGLSASMKQVGIRRNVPAILGQMVFWLTMCVFFTAAFQTLGLESLSGAMDRIVAYIPNLLVATVVVVVGLLLASFVRGVIATSADRMGITYAEHLANGCYYVLALMTFIGAFDQLQIEIGLLKEMVLIAFAAVALGFGLAFGLGGRDVMSGILAGYYTRQRLQAGDHVSVAGLDGIVREVGPVATVIETQEHGLVNRHSVPNTRMLSEAVR
ncbi:MAG TPA: mechanosensitive ion channel domain-containing protein [Pirellulales bacterium]|jgi:small-conductance mechanosensitive channel|nr:mechanosensitive ion channel domain-containing protein [Pirellulales bacterium]